MDRGVAAEPFVPKPASPQFAAALSEVALASFAAPIVATELGWVPYCGGRWRCPPPPDARWQPTYFELLGDRSWLIQRLPEASVASMPGMGDDALAPINLLCTKQLPFELAGCAA